MSRAVRTGFAWERDTGAPFINIAWDYRRGPLITPRIALERLGALLVAVAFWSMVIAVLRGCGGQT